MPIPPNCLTTKTLREDERNVIDSISVKIVFSGDILPIEILINKIENENIDYAKRYSNSKKGKIQSKPHMSL